MKSFSTQSHNTVAMKKHGERQDFYRTVCFVSFLELQTTLEVFIPLFHLY